MSHTITQPEISYQYHMAKRKPSMISRFFTWAVNEDQEHHIAWVGASVTSMTALFFPATMAVVLLNGAVFGLIVAAMAALVLVVITNLASMQTKYTIPFFFLGILIDIGVVVASFFIH
ncbi:MAG: hypothetical protein JST87_03580 [Bacteroidetes bacterium]|nr:hypothetical protein [Bacteroidota bacterium]MBS1934126.1 hypothetical protein [Bacteroidota bacterium]